MRLWVFSGRVSAAISSLLMAVSSFCQSYMRETCSPRVTSRSCRVLLAQPAQFFRRLVQGGLQCFLLLAQGLGLLQGCQRLLPDFEKLLLLGGGSAAVGQRGDIGLQLLDGAEFGLVGLLCLAQGSKAQAGEQGQDGEIEAKHGKQSAMC